jgi:hypothetical protein
MSPSPIEPHVYTTLPKDRSIGDSDYCRRCNDRYHCKHHYFSHLTPDISDTDLDTDQVLQSSSRHADYEHYSRTQFRLCSLPAHDLHDNEILVLSPSMETIKIAVHIPGCRSSSRAIRVAVAGHIRILDVVKKVVPKDVLYHGEIQVKTWGTLMELGPHMTVGDVAKMWRSIMKETEDVEVRVVVGGSVKDAKGPRDAVHGWEREMGRTERMRVF